MAFVNSGLLRIARQDAGLSQGEAAERLGIPQVMLSRYENAIAIPSNNILERASNAYDVPTSFFEQTDTVLGAPVSVHPMWRKKTKHHDKRDGCDYCGNEHPHSATS